MHVYSSGKFLLISQDSRRDWLFSLRLLPIYSKKIKYSDLCLDHLTNITEFLIHARYDTGCSVHNSEKYSHDPYLKAWSLFSYNHYYIV